MQKIQGGNNYMNLAFLKNEDSVTINFSGELDHHTAKEVKHSLDSYLSKVNLKEVVFDLKDMSFMDSSGIGVVLGSYKRLKKSGTKIYVKNVNKQIDKVFKVSGIYQVLIKID